MDNKDFLEKLDAKIDEFNRRMDEQEQNEWFKIRSAWKAVNDVHAQLKYYHNQIKPQSPRCKILY